MGKPLGDVVRSMIRGPLTPNTATLIGPIGVIDEHGRRLIFAGGLTGATWVGWSLREDITPPGRRRPLQGALVDVGDGRPPFI